MRKKVHKEIVNLIHMNQAVLSKFYEETWSLYMMEQIECRLIYI